MWSPQKEDKEELGYPNICAEQPAHGSAFCPAHSKVVENLGFPSQLRQFLIKCGANPTEYGKEGRRKVNSVLEALSREQATGLTETGADMQGISRLLENTELFNEDNAQMAEVSTRCHKDIGDVYRLHKWSRGIQVIVGAGGVIEYWALGCSKKNFFSS